MAVPDLKDAIEYLQREDLEAAIASLERKVEELPAYLTAHVLLARAYEADHQWRKALTCWENVCFLMPNSPVGREGKARTLRRLNREPNAQEDAAPAAEPAPPGDEEASPAPDPTPDADAPSDTGPGGEAAEASSPPPDELAQLRKQADAEARSGGARPGLADRPPSAASKDDEPGPEERVDQLEDEDDLDHLIKKLESAHIEPTPDAEAPPPDLDNEADDLVSETLARIHEAQNQYRRAARIYVRLASQEPDRTREHLEKAARMRRKADSASSDTD
ncbi:MAG: hypothetical protein ABEL97_03670 [Salinibacter sp.]